MTTLRWVAILVAGLLLAGCEKRDQKSPVSGTLPRSCSYSAIVVYNGAVNPGDGPQAVAVQADLIDHPYDIVTVVLCKNADCDTTVPSTWCAEVPLGAATPCKTSTPSNMIGAGHGVVSFNHAGTPGYSDQDHRDAGTPDIPAYTAYVITESLCR